VVVKAVPGDKMDGIKDALNNLGLSADDRSERIRRLFWTPIPTKPNTAILFLGEFKEAEGDRNQNQLLLGFATAQYQRRRLGLPSAVIWGITCANGIGKVYSSIGTDQNPFVSPSIMVPIISAAQLEQGYLLVQTYHMELNSPDRFLALLLLSLQAV
jgi:hypothetical protein